MAPARIATRLLLVALPAYFAWEMLQAPAFTGMPAGWWRATVMCAQATVGDGVILLAVCAIVAAMFCDWHWFAPPSIKRYMVLVLIGVILQITVEWVMVRRMGRWGYQPWHPIAPILGVGILPILQPVVLLPLVFWGLSRIEPP